MMRIDKFFSELGLKSRSEIKQDIKKGLVKVDGKIVKEPDFKIDEKKAAVEYKGEIIAFEKYVYYILNKPEGFVTARSDDKDRTVMDLIEDKRADLSPVGRLDKDTTGLLIITNDGGLNHKLMSLKSHVPKTYFAVIEGELRSDAQKLFETGIDIGDDKPCKSAKLKLIEYDEKLCWFFCKPNDKSDIKGSPESDRKILSFAEITITEGRYHQVKRMVAAVGGKVVRLKRVAIGGLMLPSDLAEGEYKKVSLEYLNEHINSKSGKMTVE